MSDPTTQEPTMEEILASIRRIISEDDAPAAEAPHEEVKAEAPVHVAVPEPEPEPELEEHEDEDVLELTEPAGPAETHGDLDVFESPPAPVPVHEPEVRTPEPKPVPKFEPAQVMAAPKAPAPVEDEHLVTGGAEDLAASHFGMLSQSIAMPTSGHSLEDVVRQLLRPLLKEWLDQHLPGIVEEKVQAEVERIARRRV